MSMSMGEWEGSGKEEGRKREGRGKKEMGRREPFLYLQVYLFSPTQDDWISCARAHPLLFLCTCKPIVNSIIIFVIYFLEEKERREGGEERRERVEGGGEGEGCTCSKHTALLNRTS
jgi:hypothetical protein